MREKLLQFMAGRNGNDEFNRFLLAVDMLLILLSIVFSKGIGRFLSPIALILLGLKTPDISESGTKLSAPYESGKSNGCRERIINFSFARLAKQHCAYQRDVARSKLSAGNAGIPLWGSRECSAI